MSVLVGIILTVLPVLLILLLAALVLLPVFVRIIILVFVLILILTAAVLLVLVLVFVLILVLLFLQQSLGVGVVVLGLLVGRIHPQGVLVAFERLRVFFLLELGVAQVVESLGPFLVGAGGVCGDAFEGLGRLFVFFGAVEGAPQVVGGLEVFGGRFERLRVSFDAAVVPLLREIPVALAHEAALGVFLGRGAADSEQQGDEYQ